MPFNPVKEVLVKLDPVKPQLSLAGMTKEGLAIVLIAVAVIRLPSRL